MKSKKIKATYRNGMIQPLDRIDLPEGQELEVEFRVLQKTPHELTPEEATQTYTASYPAERGMVDRVDIGNPWGYRSRTNEK